MGNQGHALLDKELEGLIGPNGYNQRPVYQAEYMNGAKKPPVTQAYNNGDMDISLIVGSAKQTDSDTVGNDEEEKRLERRAYRENQRQNYNRNNMIHDGIKNKNIALLIPRAPPEN